MMKEAMKSTIRGMSWQVAYSKKRDFASYFVLFIAAISVTIYGFSMHKKAKTCTDLREKIRSVEGYKKKLLEEREELLLEIKSLEDQEWLEMVLKKRLGVVPEGQTKVYFKRDE